MNQDLRLWLVVLAGPSIWFVQSLANFALSPWACAFGWKPWLFVVTLIALAIAAGSGVLAWKLWRQAGLELPGEMGGAVAHHRALALAGVLLSSMFFLVVVAQAVPNLILGACE